MATHDYVISNASGAAVRADLNNALAAIVSNNSNATEPSTTYSYMLWADTGSSPPVMKLRNAANDGWVTLFQLDGVLSSTLAVEDGTAGAPPIYFKDSGTDTGIFSPTTDEVAISTGGTEALRLDSSGRLLVGTSTDRTGALLQVEGSASVARSSGGSFIVGTTYVAAIGVNSNNYLQLRNTGATANNDYTADIRTSAGDGAQPSNSGFYVRVKHWNGSVYENRDVFNVKNNGNATFLGTVTANGVLLTSDRSLKENIKDANLDNQWADIKQIRLRNYSWIQSPELGRQIGVIAQELEETSPNLVARATDENGKELEGLTKIKFDALQMKMLGALQKSMERIEQLEQRLTNAGII